VVKSPQVWQEDDSHAGRLAPFIETTMEVVGTQLLPAARVPTGLVGPAREVEVWKRKRHKHKNTEYT
jgi:hypothetical protein